MNRRHFLKYVGSIAAVAGASALGLDYLSRLEAPRQTQSTSTTVSTISSEITTAPSTLSYPADMPLAPTRLLATIEDFQRVWRLIQSDPFASSYYETLNGDAELLLNQPPYQYHLCPQSECHDAIPIILNISGGVAKRIYTLGVSYRLNGDERYSERAWTELKSAAAFPNWNHENQFLDTAIMTQAFAIGYDWFPWTDDQRKILRDAIVEKGLKPAEQAYQGADFGWWSKADNNWNLICNGGAGMGALALLPELPDLCKEIIDYAVQSLPVAMKQFAPDGGWPEGPDYWNFGTVHACVFLASLETALQTDHGLDESPGFSETGLFPIYISGPFYSTFNYADSDAQAIGSPQMFWLGREFGRSIYSRFARTRNPIDYNLDCAGAACIPLGLLWVDESSDASQSNDLPPNRYFRGVEVVSLRSNWDDDKALFVGFKAGSNHVNHGHLDIGSFVLDALGLRWATDLGRDDYSLPGYFDTSAQRWTYYRMRAEGHNTIVLNSGWGPDQNTTASTKITRYKSDPSFSFAIADLTPAYSSPANPTVQQMLRGIGLSQNHFIVQDEITPAGAIDLWWFMHTGATASVGSDDRTATLSQGGYSFKRLWCTVMSPSEATFAVMDAKPLPSSPKPSGQASNAGVQKLAVHLRLTVPTTISVLMYPLQSDQEQPEQLPPITPLSQW